MTPKKQLGMVSGFLTLSAVLGGLSISAQAATFYVSKASYAKDTYTVSAALNNVNKPFKTIKKALDMAKDNPSAGVNQIVVEPGTYPEQVIIRQNGLTLIARNDAKYSSSRSILRPVGPQIWDGVSIEASNVTLRGFEVDGSQAYVDGTQENGDEGASTNGITIQGRHPNWDTTTIEAALHVSVVTCVVHDFGGGGITADGKDKAQVDDHSLNTPAIGGPDYITLEDNVIYNNCYWSRWAPSGISLHSMTNTNPGDTGVHNIVSRNTVYGNTAKYTKPGKISGELKHSDGNGIIVDFCTNANAPTLIENNVVYLNGGRGIYALNSSNVTIRNNSTYNNNQDPDIYTPDSEGNDTAGEFVAFNVKNVKFLNNVSYGFKSNFRIQSLWGYQDVSNVTIRACTYYGDFGVVPGSGVTDWSTTFHGDPHYISPNTGNLYPNIVPQQSGQTLTQSQTVIDRGSSVAGDYAAVDYYYTPRPQGSYRDRGAFELSLPSN